MIQCIEIRMCVVWRTSCALAAWLILATNVFAELRFVHHFGDRKLEGRNLGQTDLADLDRDGDLDFIVGEQRGRILLGYGTTWVRTRHRMSVAPHWM
jgi:hypothetical protein